MSKDAIQGTFDVPITANKASLATIMGLPSNTLFHGYYCYPNTNTLSVTEDKTTTTGANTDVTAGSVSPIYNAVRLGSIVISAEDANQKVVVKGEGAFTTTP